MSIESSKAEQFEARVASEQDDSELRRLLRETYMPGAITVAMTREPNFFLASTTEGDVHGTLLLQESKSGRAIACAGRSYHDAYVNGQATRLGYISGLRLDRSVRGGKGILHTLFDAAKHHRIADALPYYLTTIIADNHKAIRALTSGWSGLPCYTARGFISSFLFPVPRRKTRNPAGCSIRQAEARHLPEIAACLQRSNQTFQFAPRWSAEDLASPTRCRDLAPEHFTIVLKGARVKACVAVWDQRPFKQMLVRSYRKPIGSLRPLVNLLGPLAGIPKLPRAGENFPYACLSLLAVDPEEPALFLPLIHAACAAARDRGLANLSLGLAENHPHWRTFKHAIRHIEYRSILYTVHWPDGEKAVAKLDQRPAHVEIATL